MFYSENFVSWGSGSKQHLLKNAGKKYDKIELFMQYCWHLVNAENYVSSEHVNKAYERIE